MSMIGTQLFHFINTEPLSALHSAVLCFEVLSDVLEVALCQIVTANLRTTKQEQPELCVGKSSLIAC